MSALKNYCCLRRYDEFSNFSSHRVAFPSEADAALGFLFTLWAKPKSKIRLIRQIENLDNCIEKILLHLLLRMIHLLGVSVSRTGVGFFMVDIYPADWVKFLSLPAKSEIWKLRSFCNILRGEKTFQNF